MKIGIPVVFLALAMANLLFGLIVEDEGPIIMALVLAGASALAYIMTLRARLAQTLVPGEVERRLNELEHRLSLTEGELDLATDQVERLRVEREFDRQLEAGRGIAPGRTTAPLE
jgi:hypothetical protein